MVRNSTMAELNMAEAMGARVSIAGPVRGMYLIIGRDVSHETLVRMAGGEVVLRFNGRKILATLPFAGYLMIRSSHAVSHIGPVSVDLKRLAQVSEMLSRTSSLRSGSPR